MSALPFLHRRRKQRVLEKQHAENRLSNAVISIGVILVVLFGSMVTAAAFTYASILADLPAPDQLPAMMDAETGSLLQPTRIYDRSGDHLLVTLAPWDAQRVYLQYKHGENQLPDSLVNSTLALLDPNFWTHPGFSFLGLTQFDQHPTLAQRLVFNLLLWDEAPGLRRAIRERFLAAQITARFGREKIIEWYLNSANYGHYAYGAEAASQLYFGKPAARLNLAEAALLATVNQSPSANPFDAPQLAIRRQIEALDLLQVDGMEARDEINRARQTSLIFQSAQKQQNFAPAFIELVLSQLEGRVNRSRVEQGGMAILTTLDFDLQTRADCALRTQFARLGAANEALQSCSGAETLPPLPPGQKAPDAASAVVIDPRSGQILALIGDVTRQETTGTFEEAAFLTAHRPGSLLTPFIYLAGFTRGLSPATLVWDLPPENNDPNVSAASYRGPLRLRAALMNDSLTTAAQVFDQMGAGLIQQTMTPFGLDIPAANLQSLLETENHYSVIQMAHAYGVFAAQGALTGFEAGSKGRTGLTLFTVLSVQSLDGRFQADWGAPATDQIVSAQLAYLLTDVLSDTLRDGPGSNMGFEFDRPVAYKTAQTSDGLETWSIGYTPYRVVVVWMGGEGITSRPAAGLWAAILRSANIGVAPDGWTQPPGMLRLKVCDPSGMLPGEACPNIVDEIFIDGYQPVQTDTLYRSYAVNRETGLLATVFTPEQKVEKRVYMLVPPEAQAWARAANLPVPPVQYDNIQPPAPNPEVNIISPAMFDELKGSVVISGTADGANFSYYRLQYGQGLNPETWIQIGADIDKPVINGMLAEWDTSALNGLYSLQLLVIRSDNSLQTSTVQVSLSNP